MKLAVRIIAYVVLLLLASFCLAKFREAYGKGGGRSRLSAELADPVPPAEAPVPGETNAAVETNAVASEAVTNALAGTATNVVLAATNPAPPAAPAPKAAATSRSSASFVYLGGFVLFLLGTGGLAAWDVTQFLGNRAGRSVMAEDYEEHRDPDYEAAEEVWAKGNHLEAVGMMREYLKRNPAEQHVAIRIAEIYEKDLGNFLAAALELEEVLDKRLPREKWGWTAIRLSNLYSGRLNQPDKALGVLNRIVNDYPETAAARKARERLELPEPEEAAPAAPEEATAPPPAEDATALPKGFRPRK